MKSIERIFQKISQPSKKQTLKRALITGFNLTKQDSSNLKIMLKRMGVKYKADAGNNTLLRLYLNAQYKEQVRLQKLAKTETTRKKKDSELKLKRLLQILKESEVKPTKTRMGSHYVKLVK
ncbi:hypothetical protein N9P67_00280 [Flavobacteriaceae bacterium]|nr:hypothetical protein [Flavobacteriaceae bacterium]